MGNTFILLRKCYSFKQIGLDFHERFLSLPYLHCSDPFNTSVLSFRVVIHQSVNITFYMLPFIMV